MKRQEIHLKRRPGLAVFLCPKCEDVKSVEVVSRRKPWKHDFTCKVCDHRYSLIVDHQWEARRE